MTKRGLLKHFHLAVEAVNARLVEEFETGSDPADVARRVGDTLVPAIHILQARTNKTPGGRDASLLEEVSNCYKVFYNIVRLNIAYMSCLLAYMLLLSCIRCEAGGAP